MNKINEEDQCCTNPIHHSKFNECGIEDKVARLHSVVQDLRRSLQWSYDREARMATKIHALENHQHSSSGACMITIEDANRGNNDMCGSITSSIDLLN